jgi:hypothetical protein
MPSATEIVSELEAFYRGYIDAFNREDIDAMGAAFDFPYAWLSGERAMALCANESDHQRGFSRIMIALKGRGWLRSGIDRFTAWPLAENLGMIMADVTRYQAGDAILERLRACYTLRRDGKTWKILTIAEVKPPFLGPADVPR